MTIRLLALIGAVALVLTATSTLLGAQSTHRSSAYVLIRGNDTLAVERVRREDGRASARIASPGQPTVELSFTLGEDHGIPRASFVLHAANAAADAAPLQSGTLTFVGDSAQLDMRAGERSRVLRMATKAGALPMSNNDFVLVEQLVRMARAAGVRTLTRPLFSMAGGATIEGSIAFLAGDTVRFNVGPSVIDLTVDADGNVTGGAVPAAGIRIVVLVGAAAERVSLGRPDYSAPAGAPYTAEEVTVPTPAGHRLSGTLTRPIVSVPVPAVVTITGSGQQDRDAYAQIAGGWRLFRQVADTLSRRGIAVLRLDDRGVGSSGGDVNGTSADFADDVRAAVAYLRSRPDIDPARIALVGHSEGGLIAPMVARTDARLAAVVLMAGTGYTGQRIIDFQIASGAERMANVAPAQRDSVIAAHTAEFAQTAARSPWMRYFLAYDPLPTAREVKQPVLILQGTTDQQVRAEEARMLERALRDGGNRKVTTHLLPDRNHFFLRDPDGHPAGYEKLTDPKVDGEVLGLMADWLALTLRSR